MDWPFVFMVSLGWVVCGGLMYGVYRLGRTSCHSTYSVEDENQPVIPPWRAWLNGIVAVGLLVPISGVLFDERGINVNVWDHLLGIFFAGAIAFSVGWFEEFEKRKRN